MDRGPIVLLGLIVFSLLLWAFGVSNVIYKTDDGVMCEAVAGNRLFAPENGREFRVAAIIDGNATVYNTDPVTWGVLKPGDAVQVVRKSGWCFGIHPEYYIRKK